MRLDQITTRWLCKPAVHWYESNERKPFYEQLLAPERCLVDVCACVRAGECWWPTVNSDGTAEESRETSARLGARVPKQWLWSLLTLCPPDLVGSAVGGEVVGRCFGQSSRALVRKYHIPRLE